MSRKSSIFVVSVHDQSLSPTLKKNDRVRIEPVDGNPTKHLGSIFLVATEGGNVLKRVQDATELGGVIGRVTKIVERDI